MVVSIVSEYEKMSLFAQHFHVQVALGFDPILVDFDLERSNEP